MIIVTGASKGLGKAIAQRLHKTKQRIIGISRSKEELDYNIDYISCDVGNYESVRNAVRKIKKIKEPLNAFINAAGVASMNLAVTTDKSTVEKLIQTNLLGTIFCCQLFAPLMIRQKQGIFINFSTLAVPIALKGESIYVASKAGVEGFSRVFAREMADFNIRVNCIAPGPIQTDLLKGVTDDQIAKVISQQIITKQFTKKDVCDLIELLIDPKSHSLSGQVLNIGGV